MKFKIDNRTVIEIMPDSWMESFFLAVLWRNNERICTISGSTPKQVFKEAWSIARYKKRTGNWRWHRKL